MTITRSQGRGRHGVSPAYESELAYEPVPSVMTQLGPSGAGLALIALLTPLRAVWAAQVLLIVLLLTVPGVVLLRALRVPGKAVASFPVYVPAASLVVLIGSGLAVDWIGLLAGDPAPLSVGPLLTGLELICFMLLAFSARAPTSVTIPWHWLQGRAKLTWPLILPIIAAMGALRLNGAHGNVVAVIALLADVVVITIVTALTSRLSPAQLAISLYAVGLALAWSFSLRSGLVNGFDIAHEYFLLHRTVTTGAWYTYHSGDAYGAMLSLTVLPAELHFLSGFTGLMVYKVVYPSIYAVFPVAIFSIARRVLSRRWAFVAGVFTLAQYSFTEMVGFARQEIAFLFFVTLIAVMLDRRIPRVSQQVLAIFLGLGVVVSHYSTAYMAATILGLTLPAQWALSLVRNIPRVHGIVAISFLTIFTGAFVWYGPLTHSASHAIQFIETTFTQGFDILPNRTPGENLFLAYLKGNSRASMSAADYARVIHSHYITNRPYIKPFPDATNAQYALRNFPIPQPSISWRFGYDLLAFGLLLVAQLGNLLAGIGALWMALSRKAPILARTIGVLAVAVVLVLMVVRLSGTVAAAYGEERAQLQAMVLLAITLGWTMQRIAGRHVRRAARVFAASVACLALVLVNTTYLTGVMFGGGTSDNIANSGPDYQYFYTTLPEVASARWLSKQVKTGQLVYAGEYAQVPLVAIMGDPSGLLHGVTPLTLNQHAWVYAGRTNVIDGRSFALYENRLASYVFPSAFLNTHYNRVYTNGSSEVFYR